MTKCNNLRGWALKG